MLGASTLPSWGTLARSWDDPGTLGSTRKDGWWKMVAGWALVTNNPRSLKPDSEILRPKLGILRLRRGYIGYMEHWKRDYTRMPRSLVAPTRGARGYLLVGRLSTFETNLQFSANYSHEFVNTIQLSMAMSANSLHCRLTNCVSGCLLDRQ